MNIELPNQWNPRQHQLDLWRYLENGGKRAVVFAHRRWGKDDVALNFAPVSAMQNAGTHWHCLPEYAQGRKAIWDMVDAHTGKRRIDQAFPREIRRRTREDEMFIELANGSTWQVVGSDRYNALVGAGPRGLVMSEAALADPGAWDYLMPMIEESGGWVIFISTVRGRNWFWKLGEFAQREKDWFFCDSKADETGVFSPEQLAAIRRQYHDKHGEEIGEALYRQEYFNDPDVGASLAFISGRLVAACRDYFAPDLIGQPVVWGLDVATTGPDSSVLAKREGRKWFHPVTWREPDTMRLAEMVAAEVRMTDRRPDAIFVDATGVGAGVADQLRVLLGGELVRKVIAAEKALDEKTYVNKRAECWGRMREAIRGKVEIPNHQPLREELTWPEINLERVSERIGLEVKDKIREKYGRSPDHGDAMSLTYAEDVIRRERPGPGMIHQAFRPQVNQSRSVFADFNPF